MNLCTFFILLILPLSVSANSILECHPREGKYDHSEQVVGNIVIKSDEVILFQLAPVFETVSFDLKNAVTETTRTGTWTTYTEAREMEQEIITFQVEDAGKKRRAYLTRESSSDSDEDYLSIIPLACIEI